MRREFQEVTGMSIRTYTDKLDHRPEGLPIGAGVGGVAPRENRLTSNAPSGEKF